MKRRNFLSRLLALPLGLKTRFLALKARSGGLKCRPIVWISNGQQIDIEGMIALRQKKYNEIRQKSKADAAVLQAVMTDEVVVVEEGVAVPSAAEGSQAACGYLPDDMSACYTRCILPRGHKPPHISRPKFSQEEIRARRIKKLNEFKAMIEEDRLRSRL